jgi:hypothetical protein
LGIQLFLVAAILALWWYLARQERAPGAEAGPFGALAPEEVARLVWIEGGRVRSLDRVPEGWRFRTQVGTRPQWRTDRGHTRFALELLRALERFRPQRLFAPEESLATYGLDPPAAWLVLVTQAGRAESLAVGRPTPVPRGRYAWWRGLGDRVAVLDGFLVERFVLPSDDALREPLLGTVLVDSVSALLRTSPEPPLQIRWTSRGLWANGPAGSPVRADSLLVRRLAGQLLHARVIHFLETPSEPPPESLGLRPPRAVWVVRGMGRSDTFRVGKHLWREGRLVLEVPGRPPGLVQDEGHALLVAPADTFWDRRVWPPRGLAWQEIRIASGRRELGGAIRKDGGWQLLPPLEAPGGPDPQRLVADAARNLARLRVERFVAPPGGGGGFLVCVRSPAGWDTARVVARPGGYLVRGPWQPGLWGWVPATDLDFWFRPTR